MKKLVVLCLVMGTCLWAGEEKKSRAAEEEQEREQKQAAPQGVVQRKWNLQKVLPSMQNASGMCVSADGKIVAVRSESDVMIFDTTVFTKEPLYKNSFPKIRSCSLNDSGTKFIIRTV